MPAATGRATRSAPARGLLIAAEGLDGSGKTAGLEAIARWLERQGRRTHQVSWQRSALVDRAVRMPRGRQVVTPTVAALLAAAEAAELVARDVRSQLQRGDVVLADRYAWTGVAREIARGLDPVWAAALYRRLPPPDVVLFHRQEPSVALVRAIASRPATVGAESVAGAYGSFLDRLFAAFDGLVRGTLPGPWSCRVVILDPSLEAEARRRLARDAVRPLLATGP